MEQYQLPKELDFENLRFCLDNYTPIFLDIQLVDSTSALHGIDTFKIDENLEDKTLNFRKDDSGLYILIDSNETFHFPLRDYLYGFSIEHDLNPLKPRKSILRIVLDDYLMTIDFEEKINLKFHSLGKGPHWKYWTIDKSRCV